MSVKNLVGCSIDKLESKKVAKKFLFSTGPLRPPQANCVCLIVPGKQALPMGTSRPWILTALEKGT